MAGEFEEVLRLTIEDGEVSDFVSKVLAAFSEISDGAKRASAEGDTSGAKGATGGFRRAEQHVTGQIKGAGLSDADTNRFLSTVKEGMVSAAKLYTQAFPQFKTGFIAPEDQFLLREQNAGRSREAARSRVVNSVDRSTLPQRDQDRHAAGEASRARDSAEGYLDVNEEGISAVERATRAKINSATYNNAAAADPRYRQAALSEAIGLKRTNTAYNDSLAGSRTYNKEFANNEVSEKNRSAAEDTALSTKTYGDASAKAAAALLRRQSVETEGTTRSDEYNKQLVRSATSKKKAESSESQSLAQSPGYNRAFGAAAKDAKLQDASENTALTTKAYGDASAKAAAALLARQSTETEGNTRSKAYNDQLVRSATSKQAADAKEATSLAKSPEYQEQFGKSATAGKLQEASEQAALTTKAYGAANAKAATAILSRQAGEEAAKTASSGYAKAQVKLTTNQNDQAAKIAGLKAGTSPEGTAYQASVGNQAVNAKLQEASENAAKNTQAFSNANEQAASSALELKTALEQAKTGSQRYIDAEVGAANELLDRQTKLAEAQLADGNYVTNTVGAAAAMAALKAKVAEASTASDTYLDEARTKIANDANKRQVQQAITSDPNRGQVLDDTGAAAAVAAREKIAVTRAQIAASEQDIPAEIDLATETKERAAKLAAQQAGDDAYITAEAQLVVALKARKDKIDATVAALNGTTSTSGGGGKKPTLFQRIQASNDPNPDADPLSKRTLGQFASQHATNTAGYLVPGLVFGVGIEEIAKSVEEAGKAQVAFAELNAQFTALGQGDQFAGYKQSIKDIAGNTGLATSEVAELGAAMKGIYGSTDQATIALQGVTAGAVAMGLSVKDAQDDLTAITQSFSDLQSQGGGAIQTVTNELLTLQDRTGVNAKEIGAGTAEAGPTANQVGLTTKQTASIVAAGVQVSGLSGDTIGQTLSKVLDGVSQNFAQIFSIYQQDPALRSKIPALEKDNVGQAAIQVLTDLRTLPASVQIAFEKTLGVNASALPSLTDIEKGLPNAGRLEKITPNADRTAEEVTKKLDTLTGSFDKLRQDIVNLGVGILDSGVGTSLVGVAKAAGDLVRGIGALNRETDGLLGTFVEVAAGFVALKLLIAGIKTVGKVSGIIKEVNPTDLAAKALTGSAVSLTGAADALIGAAEVQSGRSILTAPLAPGAGGALAKDAERTGFLSKFLGKGGAASEGGGLFGLGAGTKVLGGDSLLGGEVGGGAASVVGDTATFSAAAAGVASLSALPPVLATITGLLAGRALYNGPLGGQNGGYQQFLDHLVNQSSTPAGYDTKGTGIAIGSDPYKSHGNLASGATGVVNAAGLEGVRLGLSAYGDGVKSLGSILGGAKNLLDNPIQDIGTALTGLSTTFKTLWSDLQSTLSSLATLAAHPSRVINPIDRDVVTPLEHAADHPGSLIHRAGGLLSDIPNPASVVTGTLLGDATTPRTEIATGSGSALQTIEAELNKAKGSFTPQQQYSITEDEKYANQGNSAAGLNLVQLFASEAPKSAPLRSAITQHNTAAATAAGVATASDPRQVKSALLGATRDAQQKIADATAKAAVDQGVELTDFGGVQTGYEAGAQSFAQLVTSANGTVAAAQKAYNTSHLSTDFDALETAISQKNAVFDGLIADANQEADLLDQAGNLNDDQTRVDRYAAAVGKSKGLQAKQAAAGGIVSGLQAVLADKEANATSLTQEQQIADTGVTATPAELNAYNQAHPQDQLKKLTVYGQAATPASTVAALNQDTQATQSLAVAGAHEDPVLIAIANLNAATATLGNDVAAGYGPSTAQYKTDLAAKQTAAQNLQDANNNVLEAGDTLAQAQAAAGNDTVAAAAAGQKLAEQQLADAKGTAAKLQAAANVATSNKTYADAVIALADARGTLLATLAGAGGDQVGSALATYQNAVQKANNQAAADRKAGTNPNNDATYVADVGNESTTKAAYVESLTTLANAKAATAAALLNQQGDPVGAAILNYNNALAAAAARAKYVSSTGHNPANDTEYQADVANAYNLLATKQQALISNLESVGSTQLFLGDITATQYISQLEAELAKVEKATPQNKLAILGLKQQIRQVQDTAGGDLNFDIPSNLLIAPTLYQAVRASKEASTYNNRHPDINGADEKAAAAREARAREHLAPRQNIGLGGARSSATPQNNSATGLGSSTAGLTYNDNKQVSVVINIAHGSHVDAAVKQLLGAMGAPTSGAATGVLPTGVLSSR